MSLQKDKALELLCSLEGYHQALKMLHWSTDNHSKHLLTDEIDGGVLGFEDELAERRRLPVVYTGSKLGLVMPMFAMDKNDRYLQPAGFYTILDLNNLIENPVEVPAIANRMARLRMPMEVRISGI